jgi:hypothetical protein
MNEGINKNENYKLGNLFDGEPEILEISKRKTFGGYSTQQIQGFEKRLERKKGNPRERLDQSELDYLEARRKAFNGE